MAWVSGDVATDSYGNISTKTGVELSNVVRDGTSVVITYRAYIYPDTSKWSTNAFTLWVEGQKFNVKAAQVQSTQNTKYYTGYVTKVVSLPVGTSSTSISVGVNYKAYNNSSPAGYANFIVYEIPIIVKPSVSNISISSVGDKSANGSYSVTNSGGQGTSSNIQISVNSDMSSASTYSGTSKSFIDLEPNRTYYVRGNSSNSAGTTYTTVNSFTTSFINPSKPTNAHMQTDDPDGFIITANIEADWDAANAGSLPVSGYRLMVYKNGLEISMEDIDSTDTCKSLGSIEALGFNVGDKIKIGLYSYSKDWEATMHFNDDGYGWGEVLSPEYTILSDKFLYLSNSGGSFEKRKMYVSINGGSFKEIRKEGFKLI